MAATDAPLSEAELDLLVSLDAARTPGLWRWWTSNSMRRLSSDPSGRDGDVAHAYIAHDGVPDISICDADARAIAAALNALPALLAEVRAARGRAPTRDGWAEPDGDDGAGDDGPRLHIPRDLLTREGVYR